MKMRDLKSKMVNVKNDLWYNIVDYSTDCEGNIVEVKADNGQWYSVANIVKLV